jgi:hypothetical protein
MLRKRMLRKSGGSLRAAPQRSRDECGGGCVLRVRAVM